MENHFREYNNTSDSIGGSPPASSNNTFQFGFSLKRPATTDPAMKSYDSNTEKYINRI